MRRHAFFQQQQATKQNGQTTMIATMTNDNGPKLFQAPDEILTMAQAGEALGVTGRTVYQWIREGRLRASKIGRLVRIKRSSIDRMLAELATTAD
jgi:excisionase family DNA binding protein